MHASFLLAAALMLPAPSEGSHGAGIRCGTKELYGKTLVLWVRGDPISCTDARRIARGSCRREGEVWSCFSFRPPAPLLAWFKESERFAERWSTWIEARRYPCREAHVSANAWAAARRSTSRAFPSRMQVLADDLLRCGQLRGKRYREVRALLGRPDEQTMISGKREALWDIGDERDSFFQVDSESLYLRFAGNGPLESAEIEQN